VDLLKEGLFYDPFRITAQRKSLAALRAYVEGLFYDPF
jgi:hypothetical protein